MVIAMVIARCQSFQRLKKFLFGPGLDEWQKVKSQVHRNATYTAILSPQDL